MPEVHPPLCAATRRPSSSRRRSSRRILAPLLTACLVVLSTVAYAEDVPVEEPVSDEAAAALDSRIAYLEERLFTDLMARVEARSEPAIRRATERNLAAMVDGFDPALESMPASIVRVSPL